MFVELDLQLSEMQIVSGEQNPAVTPDVKKLRSERKAVRLTASIVGVFTVLWMPYVIGRFIHISGSSSVLGQYLSDIGASMGIFNSSINWVVYGLASRDFRKAVVKMLTSY